MWIVGSSPRVWGQGEIDAYSVMFGGIIPTRVGTSIFDRFRSVNTEDHPHACGDKRFS